MMILRSGPQPEALNESADREDDPVALAALALAEAAMSSGTEYTVEQLQGMVADHAAELSEAGGLVSWLSRAYTGKDSTLPSKITSEMNIVHTVQDRDRQLAQVDKLIAESKGITAPQAMFHLVTGAAGVGILGFVIRLLKQSSPSVAKYRTALHKVRGELARMKFDKDGKRVRD